MSITSESRDRILFVGLSCFDVVTVSEGYPLEDSDTRATDTALRRGGNASNSCTCFVALLRWLDKNSGHHAVRGSNETKVEFFGTMATDVAGEFMEQDMINRGILTENIVKVKDATSVMAVIVVNKENGSRTIIHCNKNLPELKANDFSTRINVSNYRWIHLESRKNIQEIVNMVRFIRSSDPNRMVTVSVELEQPYSNRDIIWKEDVDFFICSKDYAKMKGAKDLMHALDVFAKMIQVDKHSKTTIIVPWSELGASAVVINNKSNESKSGEQLPITKYSCPSYPPKKLVDTTGAGDSFIAGLIFSLEFLTNKDVKKSIEFACKFAGAKCGSFGNEGLDNFEQFL